jgi:hypothetical protein
MYELYKLEMGGSVIARYTSRNLKHKQNETIDGVTQSYTYEPISINRSDITVDSTLSSGDVDLEVKKGNEIAQLFKQQAPEERIFITITKIVNDVPIVIFRGVVSGVEFSLRRATIKCVDILYDVDKQALRYGYQYQCNHQIYESHRTGSTGGCGLLFSNFATSVTLTDVQNGGRKLYSNAFITESDSYVGGVIQIGGRRINVINHDNVSGFIELYEPMNVIASNNIMIAPGCKNLPDGCKALSVQNYQDRFLGFTQIPTKNPYYEL